MRRGEDHISRSVDSYNRTGRRLFVLAALLLVLLGAVAVPLAMGVYRALPTFIEKSDGGPVLAGALVGLGSAVAGIFFGAAGMIRAIPAILHARNENPALPTKDAT
jgi:hypothetical protein